MSMTPTTEDAKTKGRAVTTLERLGYGWNGGAEWRPPLGDAPDFEAQARRQILKNILARMAGEHESFYQHPPKGLLQGSPLYYAIKNEGEDSGWRYNALCLSIYDLKTVHDLLIDPVEFEKVLPSVKDQVNTLKDEVTTYNDVIHRQNKEIQELQQNKQFLEDEIAGLNTLLELDKNTISELRTELALLRQENDFLHNDNAKYADTVTEMNDMLRGLQPVYQAHHVKRGTNYDVLSHTVRVQCETPLQDMEEVMLYIGEDRHLSVRRHGEFFDGRFITSIDKTVPVSRDMASILPLESRRWRQKAGLRIAHTIWGDCVYDLAERRRRMVEELFEVIQASGIPDLEMTMIQRDVYSREPGEISQELGGASYTMMSFAEVAGLCLEDCETAEIERVRRKNPDEMRIKQNAKAARGIAIPSTAPLTIIPNGEAVATIVLLSEHETIEDFMGGNHGR